MAAEALVSLLVENLGSLTFQWIREKVKLVKGVDGEVSNLETKLRGIQAVLEDAEKKKLSSSDVKIWVENLEAVSYDMDNVLDEWNTAILEYKIEKEEGEDLLAPKKKVCLPMPSCFCSPKVNRVGLHLDIAHKVKELNGQLDEIAKEKDTFNLNTTTVEPPPYVPLETISLIDEAKTFGRDEDKKNLVSKLVSESSHHEQGLQVISIVGMGGLGKTTLAQLAFNNEKVEAHFDQRIWVCVSDPFVETKIARAIIGAIERKETQITALDGLVQHVRKLIEGKKFLLVLDDVWTEDDNKWEPLERALTYGAVGSRVLVTTRKREVSRVMGATNERMIMLKELSDTDCLSIFEGLAFRERNEDEVEQLKEIGQKIAGKSKGLPLVAKILGRLLRSKSTREEWEEVLSSELWNSEVIEEKLFAPFLLSYYDLSAKEKRCFSYCSVFPKDHIIERSQLIEMWMSQGFLGHNENSVKKGRECFDKLAMRSFFQNLKKSEYGDRIISCQMHDIVHDFAQFLTKNDCIIMEVDVIEERVNLVVDESARHLTLAVRAVDEESAQCPALTYNQMNEKNLRTLFVFVNGYFCPVDTSLFLKLKCLRTLNLSFCGLKILPESIGKLIHLRYLNLERNYDLMELPDSLCNLCNLQTLNLYSCGRLRRLPKGMGKLVNLKHLYIRESGLEGLPKGFGRLTSLRTLDALIVADDKEAYFDIGDLSKLKNLQLRDSLRIQQCRYFGNGDEAKKIDLKNKEHFAQLTLDFGRDGHGSEDDFAILEALEPHQKVASICIDHYMGVTLSTRWMTSLKKLTDIHIYHCDNCETLPSLGKLPSLKSLSIGSLRKVKTVGVELLGISKSDEEVGGTERDEPLKSPMISFPNLESLEFWGMDQLEKWEGYVIASDTSLTIMPRLTTLKFEFCTRLQVLPDFLATTTTLKQLTICHSRILEERCRKGTGEEWTKISHIPNIKIAKLMGEPIWIQKDEDIVA